MKHKLQILTILFLFTSQALGQSAQITITEIKDVYRWRTTCTLYGCKRVRIRDKQKFQYLGMSVCLGRLSKNEWLFATCSHNFGESGTIKVLCKGKWTDGRFIARTNTKGNHGDLALLKVRHTGNLKCASLADAPTLGQTATFVKRNGNRISAKVVSSTKLQGQSPIQGDSGTAIYNTHKEVIGILWGAVPNETHYTPVFKLKKFILAKVGKLPICGDFPSIIDAPEPPIEEPAISYDHTNILNRIKNLENKNSFNPENLESANKQLLKQIVKLENRIEGLKNQTVDIEWVDLDGNVVLRRTFPSNRIQLYANTIDIYNGKRIDRDTYKPNEPMVIRIIKKK